MHFHAGRVPSAQRHYCIFSGKFPILCAVLSHVNSLERCPERLKFTSRRRSWFEMDFLLFVDCFLRRCG